MALCFRDDGSHLPRTKPYTTEELKRMEEVFDRHHPDVPENKLPRGALTMSEKEVRLNVLIPEDLRQDLQDLAYITKGVSEKQLIVSALRTLVAKIKDQGGEKVQKALDVLREAREV